MSYPFHKISGGGGTVVTRTEQGFQGLDTGGGGIGRSMSRAADNLNLVWEGEALRRRPHCTPWFQVDQPVYGIYIYREQLLVHAGNRLLRYLKSEPFGYDPIVVYTAMNEAPSRGIIRRQKVEERCCEICEPDNWVRRTFEKELLFICDGKNFLFYDGLEIHSCIDDYWGAEELPEMACFYSTVPQTVVAKLPNTGGGDVDPRGDNRLSQFRTESFYVDEETRSFILNCPLSAINTKMPFEFRLRDNDGIWRAVSGFGEVLFKADPAGTFFETNIPFSGGMTISIDHSGRVVAYGTGENTIALDGMDNFTITYGVKKERPDAIGCATAMGLFGPEGGNNVLFLGGSPQTPGVDYFSAPDDFLCFYETSYEQLGNINQPITGYCPLKDGRLAVLKNDPGESAVYYRDHKVVELGKTLAGDPYRVDAYPSVAGAAVEGCLRSATVGWAGNEPCFLTAGGIYTVRTVSDELINLNETVLRSRSVEELLGMLDKDSAYAVNWKEYYLLFFGSDVLITDGRIDNEGNYRFMRWEVPLSVISSNRDKGILYLGGENGWIYRMGNNLEEESFSAYWQTPAIEESNGLKMLFHRLELLITPAREQDTSFQLIRDGREGSPRLLKMKKILQTQWIPIASRFGRANTLALRLFFPQDPAFRLWGLRLVYRKGKNR